MWPGGEAPRLTVDLSIDLDVGRSLLAAEPGEPDIRVAVPGSQHHLLDRGAQLILGPGVAGSQLLDGAVDIGLTP